MDPWIKMQDTFTLAGNWAVNTLTSISDIDCQTHPQVWQASAWCWEKSEQAFRPCNNCCLWAGRDAGLVTEGSRRGVLLTDLCFLTWVLSSEGQWWITFFFFLAQCADIFFLTEALALLMQRVKSQRGNLWPQFLLMSKVCSCLYSVPLLIFLPFALPPPYLCFTLECFKNVNYVALSTGRMRYFCHVSLRSLNPLNHTWSFPCFHLHMKRQTTCKHFFFFLSFLLKWMFSRRLRAEFWLVSTICGT